MFLTLFFSWVLSANAAEYVNRTTSPHTIDGITVSYPATYDEARKRFQEHRHEFRQKALTVMWTSYPVPFGDEDLSIDALYIPGKNNRKLLILSSGLHGAEGFTGSALQHMYLQSLVAANEPPATDVLLIHALNPYGFKHFRRVNTRNVDLNRNHASEKEFHSTNKAFEELRFIYTPTHPATTGLVAKAGFYFGVIMQYLFRGKKMILQSLSGQYKYERALFYGGHEPETESEIVQRLISERITGKSHVLHIDIHTGFGEAGKLHLYGSDEFTSGAQKAQLKKIFPNANIDTGSDKDFYPTFGDLVDWTWKAHPDVQVVPMVFEFGTSDSQTLSGGLESLWTSVLENQHHYYGSASKNDMRVVRERYENLFNPQDPLWQKTVLEQGWSALGTATRNLEQWE